jgi:peptide maturation system protein (TIGR04066 family)
MQQEAGTNIGGEFHNVVLYPYSIEYVQFLRHHFCGLEASHFIPLARKGEGLTGVDAIIIDGGHECGVQIANEMPSDIDENDLLILTTPDVLESDSGCGIDIRKAIASTKVHFAVLNSHSSEKSISSIKSDRLLWPKEPETYRFQGRSSSTSVSAAQNRGMLEKMEKPVVLIAGMGPQTNKYELLLAVGGAIKRRGYKVLLIGSREYSSLMGALSLYGLLKKAGKSAGSRIQLINCFMKWAEEFYQPDIILVSAPGGFCPIDAQFNNDYGMATEEISLAIKPDVSIVSLYCSENYKAAHLREIEQIFRWRMFTEIACYVMSNTWIDTDDLLEKRVLNIFYAKKAHLKLALPQWGIPCFRMHESSYAEMIADEIISKLRSFRA